MHDFLGYIAQIEEKVAHESTLARINMTLRIYKRFSEKKERNHTFSQEKKLDSRKKSEKHAYDQEKK